MIYACGIPVRTKRSVHTAHTIHWFRAQAIFRRILLPFPANMFFAFASFVFDSIWICFFSSQLATSLNIIVTVVIITSGAAVNLPFNSSVRNTWSWSNYLNRASYVISRWENICLFYHNFFLFICLFRRGASVREHYAIDPISCACFSCENFSRKCRVEFFAIPEWKRRKRSME